MGTVSRRYLLTRPTPVIPASMVLDAQRRTVGASHQFLSLRQRAFSFCGTLIPSDLAWHSPLLSCPPRDSEVWAWPSLVLRCYLCRRLKCGYVRVLPRKCPSESEMKHGCGKTQIPLTLWNVLVQIQRKNYYCSVIGSDKWLIL